jgi:hypothetical protein
LIPALDKVRSGIEIQVSVEEKLTYQPALGGLEKYGSFLTFSFIGGNFNL